MRNSALSTGLAQPAMGDTVFSVSKSITARSASTPIIILPFSGYKLRHLAGLSVTNSAILVKLSRPKRQCIMGNPRSIIHIIQWNLS